MADLRGRAIGFHSLGRTAIHHAIRDGASMHDAREFAGHVNIRTTESAVVADRRPQRTSK